MFDFGSDAELLLSKLKERFGVTDDAEVVSRALKLADLPTEVAGETNVVKLSGADAARSQDIRLRQ